MIFVTVGTHEQQFNRLIKKVDELKGKGFISDDVVMQIGFSTYEPKFCEYYDIMPYDKMWDYVKKARIVITHGGPSSFLMPLQLGKTPIVVPRQKKYGEHINNHQIDFTEEIRARMHNIIQVVEISELQNSIINYDNIISSNVKGKKVDNNIKFNKCLENVVDSLFGR